MIPNFRLVDGEQKVWRGGQPGDFMDWLHLRDLGVVQVIKLNPDDDPCADEVPEGMALMKVPISLVEQILGEPDLSAVRTAVSFVCPGTYIHCRHGQDRTGLIVGLWRIACGWSAREAWDEMLQEGYHHGLLLGLDKAWADLSGRMASFSGGSVSRRIRLGIDVVEEPAVVGARDTQDGATKAHI